MPILERKLAVVQARYGRSDFEKRHYALLALMCVYGIELLPDNAAECRENLAGTFARFLKLNPRSLSKRSETKRGDVWLDAARAVLTVNIVQGNALDMTDAAGEPITIAEWGYLGRGRYQRRDFRYASLVKRSTVTGDLLTRINEHETFVPIRTYPPISVEEVAADSRSLSEDARSATETKRAGAS